MCRCVVEDGRPLNARFMASILFKNTILSNDPAFKNLWIASIPANQREQIKRLVLTCLGNQHKEVRKASAIAVASIAKIELPRKEWPQLIAILAKGANDTALENRLCAQETLSYITEDIDNGILTPEQVDTIFIASIYNMQVSLPNDLKELAISCIGNTIKFSSQRFQSNNAKEVMEVIFRAIDTDNTEVKKKGIQALVETIKVFYDFINPYIANIWQYSMTCISSKDEDISMQAIEIWCTIADIERKRGNSKQNFNFIMNSYRDLAQIILKNMCRHKERVGNEWCITVSSGCCLMLITQIVGEKILEIVLKFIATNSNSPDLYVRDACILAFGSILIGPAKEKIDKLVSESYHGIIKMLADPSIQVKDTVLFALMKMIEVSPEFMLSIPILQDLVSQLKIAEKIHIKIASRSCKVFTAISKVLINSTHKQLASNVATVFSSIMEFLFTQLKSQTAFTDNYNLVKDSSHAIGELCRAAPAENVNEVLQICSQLCLILESVISQSFPNKAKSSEYVDNITQAIFCCLLRIDFSKEFMVTLFELIIKVFQAKMCMYEEGIMLLSRIATKMEQGFDQLMPKIGKYISYGIQIKNEPDIARLTLLLVAEIARSIAMEKYIDGLMPMLLELIKSAETDKRVKMAVFIVFSDLLMTNTSMIIGHYPIVLEYIKNAAQYSITGIPDPDDEETYFIKLQEVALENYASLMYGIKGTDMSSIFSSNVDFLLSFIKACNTKELREEIAHSSIGILGDIVEIYPQYKAQLQNESYIKELMAYLKKVKGDDKWVDFAHAIIYSN